MMDAIQEANEDYGMDHTYSDFISTIIHVDLQLYVPLDAIWCDREDTHIVWKLYMYVSDRRICIYVSAYQVIWKRKYIIHGLSGI